MEEPVNMTLIEVKEFYNFLRHSLTQPPYSTEVKK